MKEGLWTILLLVALRSPGARPLVLLLTSCWLYTYAGIWVDLPEGLSGYRASLALDCLALACGVLMLKTWEMKAWWARIVVALWVPTIVAQTIWQWMGTPSELDLVCYYLGLITFTVQAGLLAGAGLAKVGPTDELTVEEA